MEARQSVATAASKQAEDAKVKIRASRETGMKELKKMGYTKNSKFADEVRIFRMLLKTYLTSVYGTDAKGHRQPHEGNRRNTGQAEENGYVLSAPLRITFWPPPRVLQPLFYLISNPQPNYSMQPLEIKPIKPLFRPSAPVPLSRGCSALQPDSASSLPARCLLPAA